MATSTLERLLKNSIFAIAKADATLWNSIGGRFYYKKAPSGSAKPYTLYGGGMTLQRNVMAKSSPVATDIPIYFDIYSDSGTSTEAETIQGYIHDVFNSTSISLTGYSNMGLRLGPEVTIFEEDTGFWHISITYYGIGAAA